MKLPRRAFLHLAAGAAVLPAVSRVAWAQVYPMRPITMVLPFAAVAPQRYLSPGTEESLPRIKRGIADKAFRISPVFRYRFGRTSGWFTWRIRALSYEHAPRRC